MAREVLVFESLFKANKWIWAFGILFHAALAVVLLSISAISSSPVWSVIGLVQPFGVYAGFALVAGLAGLWARRIIVPRIRYISAPSDHLMLDLLIAIAISGLSMKFVTHTDIIAVKAFFLGLMRFDIQPLPTDINLLVHLRIGRAPDAHFSVFQASACAGRVLQPDPQPGRQSA